MTLLQGILANSIARVSSAQAVTMPRWKYAYLDCRVFSAGSTKMVMLISVAPLMMF